MSSCRFTALGGSAPAPLVEAPTDHFELQFSVGTRIGGQNYLPEDWFLRVLDDLASVRFYGVFAFHQYNEPLAGRIILKRAHQGFSRIPNTTLLITTNGDYLDEEYLELLYQAGNRRMNISVYGRQMVVTRRIF